MELRSTCTVCRKKRYKSKLIMLPYWVSKPSVNGTVWICKKCIPQLIENIENQIGILIKKLSFLNGQN